MKTKITTTILAASLALTSAAVSAQYVNTSEVSPTPTTEVTRTTRGSQHESSRETLRGEGEWTFESERGFDYMIAMRMDAESSSTADLMVSMLTDADLLEQELDMTYVDSFRIRGERDCEGVELEYGSMPVFMVVCADGRYVNTVMGTNEDDVIDAGVEMQDGYVPAPAGYREVAS